MPSISRRRLLGALSFSVFSPLVAWAEPSANTFAATPPLDVPEFEETVAGIERGLQAAAEGRERPFEDYVADVKRRRLERDREQKAEANERAA